MNKGTNHIELNIYHTFSLKQPQGQFNLVIAIFAYLSVYVFACPKRLIVDYAQMVEFYYSIIILGL